MPKIKKTTLAIVGRGYWGTIYINTIKSLPNIILPSKFICGKDYKKILNQKNSSYVDGVIIATPPGSHFEVALYLLKNGFSNLLIEKPLTDNLQTAIKLQKLQKFYPKANLMMGHVQLYDPAYQVMKKFAKKNLGQIRLINYLSLKSQPVKDLSILQHASPHPLSIFLDLNKTKPKKITARTTRYDNVKIVIEFEDHTKGIAKIGAVYPKRKRELEIVGDKGKIKVNEFLNPRELIFISKNGHTKKITFPSPSPLQMQIRQFISCIERESKPQTTISQGVEVVKLIKLAEQALKKGNTVNYS